MLDMKIIVLSLFFSAGKRCEPLKMMFQSIYNTAFIISCGMSVLQHQAYCFEIGLDWFCNPCKIETHIVVTQF